MCKYIIMSSKSNLCCLCYHIDRKLPSAIPLPQEVATCSYTGSIWQVEFYALPDVTPSLAGIEPAAFRLPSKCFNHYTSVLKKNPESEYLEQPELLAHSDYLHMSLLFEYLAMFNNLNMPAVYMKYVSENRKKQERSTWLLCPTTVTSNLVLYFSDLSLI